VEHINTKLEITASASHGISQREHTLDINRGEKGVKKSKYYEVYAECGFTFTLDAEYPLCISVLQC
jgi:hypothetical protein